MTREMFHHLLLDEMLIYKALPSRRWLMSKQLNVATTAKNLPEAFVLQVVFEYIVFIRYTLEVFLERSV